MNSSSLVIQYYQSNINSPSEMYNFKFTAFDGPWHTLWLGFIYCCSVVD